MDRIVRMGRFRIIAFQAIDLAAAMSPAMAEEIQSRRARKEPIVPRRESPASPLWPSGIGPYSEASRSRDQDLERNRRGFADFNKTILSPAFLDEVTPEVYHEPLDTPLSSGTPHARVGMNFSVGELIGGLRSPDMTLRLRRSALTIYQDAVAVLSFELTGDSMPTDDFIRLVADLPRVTQSAAAEKLTALLDAGFNPYLNVRWSKNRSDQRQDPMLILRRYGCSHIMVITESLYSAQNNPVPHDDVVDDPILTGILRRTTAAKDYRSAELSNIRKLCLAYKTDELYATLRGTTLAIVPGHWDSSSFLSLYIEDLITLFNFMVSRVSFIDFTLHNTYASGIQDIDSELTPNNLVHDILLLRRLLLVIDESLDVDLWINHFFTRELILQLQYQRGLPNKLTALRRRIDGLDGILSVSAQSRVADLSLATAVGQLRVAIIAVIISALLSAISTIIAVISLTGRH
jgi:hypothetical protein